MRGCRCPAIGCGQKDEAHGERYDRRADDDNRKNIGRGTRGAGGPTRAGPTRSLGRTRGKSYRPACRPPSDTYSAGLCPVGGSLSPHLIVMMSRSVLVTRLSRMFPRSRQATSTRMKLRPRPPSAQVAARHLPWVCRSPFRTTSTQWWSHQRGPLRQGGIAVPRNRAGTPAPSLAPRIMRWHRRNRCHDAGRWSRRVRSEVRSDRTQVDRAAPG